MHISGRQKSCCRDEVSLRVFLGTVVHSVYLIETYGHNWHTSIEFRPSS